MEYEVEMRLVAYVTMKIDADSVEQAEELAYSLDTAESSLTWLHGDDGEVDVEIEYELSGANAYGIYVERAEEVSP